MLKKVGKKIIKCKIKKWDKRIGKDNRKLGFFLYNSKHLKVDWVSLIEAVGLKKNSAIHLQRVLLPVGSALGSVTCKRQKSFKPLCCLQLPVRFRCMQWLALPPASYIMAWEGIFVILQKMGKRKSQSRT